MKKYWSILVFVCWMRTCYGEEIQDIAYNLSSSLAKLLHQSTGYDHLIEIYSEDALGAEVVSLNGSTVVEEMAMELLKSRELIQSVLQSTVSEAEELYSSHANTGCCSVECDRNSQYFDQIECSNNCNRTSVSHSSYRTSSDPSLDQLPNLTYNSQFNTEVNLNESVILVPINIFVKDTSILCFTEWSANLTEHFINDWNELMKLYVSLIYIGDESGALRIYPALDRRPPGCCDSCPYDKVDTYDPRQRPWYINSVQGDKHIVILIDQSGSMTGTSSTRARLSAIELLLDLGENDFFIVYRVSSSSMEILNPYNDNSDKFLQALPENKLALAKLISDMDIPNGKADFTDALNDGYTHLMNSSACHKLIYIFSDGRATFPVDNFTNIEGVSVFTFLVDVFGREDDLRTLACSNKGTFSYLDGFNQVDLSIQVLTRELNRLTPNTSNYTALTLYPSALTNSLIISFSAPSKPIINNRTQFTGVLAVDIDENLFQQIVFKAKLGTIGYAMLVSINGQLYSHPLLYSNVFKFSANLQTYDFSQYEFLCEDDGGSLRAAIINGNKGQQDYTLSFVTIEHKKRYLLGNFTYYYERYQSNFNSLAVKLPTEGVKRLNYSTPLNQTLLADIKEMLELSNNRNHVILIVGLKPYCFGEVWYTLDDSQDAVRFLTMVIEEILSNDNTSSASCSYDLFEPILRDLINVYQVIVQLRIDHDVVSTFFRFTSGLLYCINQQDTDFVCNNLDSVNFLAFAEQHINKISVHRGTEGSLLFDTVHILRPIVIPSAPDVSLGIVGIVLETSFIDNLVIQALTDTNSTLYLVDNGGYVVGSSNEFNNDSSFLGSFQPNLFNQLVNNSVFTKQKVTGYYKRLCVSSDSTEESTGSAGNRLTGLLITVVNMVWQIISSFVFLSFQSVLYYFTYGYETPVDSKGDERIQDVLDLCVSDITFYTLHDSILSDDVIVTGHIDCEDDLILFQVMNLPNTSLIAVLYDNTTSSCQQEQEEEVEIGETETRNYSTYYNIRSSLDQMCLLSENYTASKECSGSCHIATPHHWIMIITVLFIVYSLSCL